MNGSYAFGQEVRDGRQDIRTFGIGGVEDFLDGRFDFLIESGQLDSLVDIGVLTPEEVLRAYAIYEAKNILRN